MPHICERNWFPYFFEHLRQDFMLLIFKYIAIPNIPIPKIPKTGLNGSINASIAEVPNRETNKALHSGQLKANMDGSAPPAAA